jgi:hypothetical protein
MRAICDSTGRYAERNLPEWFEKIADTDIPLKQSGVKVVTGRNESQIKALKRRSKKEKNDVLALLHATGLNMLRAEAPCEVSYHDIRVTEQQLLALQLKQKPI